MRKEKIATSDKKSKFWQLLLVVLLLTLPGIYFSNKEKKKRRRAYYKKEFFTATHISLEGTSDYWDAARYLKVRQFHTRRQKKGVKAYGGTHFEASNNEINCSDLGENFWEKVDHPPHWIVNLVEKEFSYYLDKHYNQETIKAWEAELKQRPTFPLLVKYKIFQGKLYLKEYGNQPGPLQWVTAAFYRICKEEKLPDMEFFVSCYDHLDWEDTPAPIFAFCKPKGNQFIVTIPDYEMLRGYEALEETLQRGIKKHPWQKKKEIVFWRGWTSGGDFSQTNWKEIPRAKLVNLSGKFPKEVDARFSTFSEVAKKNPSFLASSSMHGSFVYPEDAMQYKYLLDVDGWANTFSRYYWILWSTSIPLKQETPFTQWYYSELQPYVHYIPVKKDFSDLLEKIAWLRKHDSEGRQIAIASALFAREKLTTENSFLYLYLLLKRYAEIYTSK